MPRGTKPAPPQQANLNEFWGKPKPKSKKVEEAPVPSGSKLKEDVDDMQVDESSHRDPKSTRPSWPQLIVSVELHSAEVASSPPYGTSCEIWSPLATHSEIDQSPLLPDRRSAGWILTMRKRPIPPVSQTIGVWDYLSEIYRQIQLLDPLRLRS